MRYIAKQYQDSDGNLPFSQWMEALKKKDKQAASRIDIRVDRAENGNFGDHKFEREGVWEMRLDFGPGYRIYYAIDGKELIILLIGGTKSSQNKDLNKAIGYWQDYQERKENDR